MDKLFDSNWALRITALIIALALFFYVQSELDTSRDNTSSDDVAVLTDVPLEVYYDDENLIVTGLPETVNVTISGPTTIVLKTELSKDFKVFVDLHELLIGEHRVEVQHENFSEKLEVNLDPQWVNISIEERVTQEFKVDPEMNNRLLADGYEVVTKTSNPATVEVTGARSVIQSISYVKATVTGESGIKESFEQEANVKVLNADLNRLDVVVQPEIVKVKVEIREYSKELPIRFVQKGIAAEGIKIIDLRPLEATVKVFGKKSAVDELSEIVLEFDVAQVNDSGEFEGKLIVPDGLRAESKTVKVKADVQKEEPPSTELEGEEE